MDFNLTHICWTLAIDQVGFVFYTSVLVIHIYLSYSYHKEDQGYFIKVFLERHFSLAFKGNGGMDICLLPSEEEEFRN